MLDTNSITDFPRSNPPKICQAALRIKRIEPIRDPAPDSPINVLVHYLKNIYIYSMENGLMDKHSEDLDVMDLPFKWQYIPIDYPQPVDYWPEKFNKRTDEKGL